MKKGFTLAEVLITLAIIGIVASLTLPTLMDNHQKKVYVTRLQKIYNSTEDALQQYFQNKNSGTFNDTGLVDMEGVKSFILEYYKLSKDCGESPINTSTCLAETYKDLSGNEINILELSQISKTVKTLEIKSINYANVGDLIESSNSKVEEKNIIDENNAEYVLSSTIKEDGGNFYCVELNSKSVFCMQPKSGQVIIDTNGKNLPNVKGRDLFLLTINESGFVKDETADNCESNTTLTGCFSRIQNDNWKMKY